MKKEKEKTPKPEKISKAHEIRWYDKDGHMRYGVGITEVNLFGKPFIKVKDKFSQKTRYVSRSKIHHIIW